MSVSIRALCHVFLCFQTHSGFVRIYLTSFFMLCREMGRGGVHSVPHRTVAAMSPPGTLAPMFLSATPSRMRWERHIRGVISAFGVDPAGALAAFPSCTSFDDCGLLSADTSPLCVLNDYYRRIDYTSRDLL